MMFPPARRKRLVCSNSQSFEKPPQGSFPIYPAFPLAFGKVIDLAYCSTAIFALQERFANFSRYFLCYIRFLAPSAATDCSHSVSRGTCIPRLSLVYYVQELDVFNRIDIHTEKAVNDMEAFYGILIPFLGTSLGAACVFFMKKSLSDAVQRSLTGFAAGVMVAASVWSLLIPAIEQSSAMGKLSFLPAFLGFWVGILFLLLLDHVVPHLHAKSGQVEGPKSQLQRTTMMVLAVTLHNIPEGMAVGVVYAGYLSGSAQITAAGALALSLGIAIQNFPEGAIISLPLRAEGMGKARAFWGGVLSGIVEPIGAVLTILAASLIVPALPYLLSFAAGAMLYVVVEELIPEMSQGAHSNIGTVFFAVGFSLMMVLDVALG